MGKTASNLPEPGQFSLFTQIPKAQFCVSPAHVIFFRLGQIRYGLDDVDDGFEFGLDPPDSGKSHHCIIGNLSHTNKYGMTDPINE